MNKSAFQFIIETIIRDYENKVSITSTAKHLKQFGADNTLSKDVFIIEEYLPAMVQLASGYNMELMNHAAKVLVKISA